MKKIFTILTIIFLSITSVFAGELDSKQTIEKDGGNLQIAGNTLALSVPKGALDTTSNLITSEVNGVTPAIDTTKYEVVGKYLKVSLQDVIGNEISFKSGVKLSFGNIDPNIKNPVVLFNDGTTNIELSGFYDPNVKIITVDNVTKVNGVFVIASKLSGNSNNSEDLLGLNQINNGTGVTLIENVGGDVINGNNLTSSGDVLDIKGTENLQERETGSNTYLFLIMLGILLSMSGVILYRKIG